MPLLMYPTAPNVFRIIFFLIILLLKNNRIVIFSLSKNSLVLGMWLLRKMAARWKSTAQDGNPAKKRATSLLEYGFSFQTETPAPHPVRYSTSTESQLAEKSDW